MENKLEKLLEVLKPIHYTDPTHNVDLGLADYNGETYLVDVALTYEEPGEACYFLLSLGLNAEAAMQYAVEKGYLHLDEETKRHYYTSEQTEALWLWLNEGLAMPKKNI